MTTISKRNKRGIGPGVFAGIIFFVLCVLLVAFARPQVSAIFWRIMAPVLAVRNSASQTTSSQLEATLASTTLALADRNALYQENLQLKQLLGRTTVSHTVLASVLQKPPGIPYDTLIIDIGATSGVKPGSLVFGGGSSVVGTVSEVYDTTSKVTLFSAPGESYQATLQKGTPISLSGDGAGSMSGEVPSNTSVKEGDAVLLPETLHAFAGSVSYVKQESGASFITVYVQLPVNVFTLQFVQVQMP